ncbi:uncharacterized protein LOC132550319 [Ylistrum balloti]|uniref:uncharacterized protein LOC132550319 n=1 Tax=Ylistrum balloti TaxID=509963 RepID=UPI002905CDDC|nr:uncharacterized protein LOC132550319 [Ylistrum balloti]
MASLRELLKKVYFIVIIHNKFVSCIPIFSENVSEDPYAIQQSLGIDISATSTHFDRPFTQYESDVYEVMRSQDSDPARMTADDTFNQESAREAIRFLRPQFGNFGRRLYFNLSSIPTKVNITYAEVVFTSPHSSAQIVGITVQNHGSLTVLHGNPTSSGYKIDVSDILHNETINTQSDLVVNVQLQHQQDSYFRFHDRRVQRLQPVLAVFENIDSEPFMRTNNNSRARRSSETDINRSSDTPTQSGPCHLQPWIINFSGIGLKSVLYPVTYEANICIGSCDSMRNYATDTNFTHHAYFKNLYHFVTNYTMTDSVPSTCCVPITYRPLSVIYRESMGDTYVMERLDNMQVTSCGCR